GARDRERAFDRDAVYAVRGTGRLSVDRDGSFPPGRAGRLSTPRGRRCRWQDLRFGSAIRSPTTSTSHPPGSDRVTCARVKCFSNFSLVSVAKDISPFKIRAISRFSSPFFLAPYMCIVSH